MTGQLRHPAWRKSSYSTSVSNCVEVAALGWRTSSYSSSEANCVQVALGGPAIGVRDSKDPHGPCSPSRRPASAFLRGVASGEFDR
ncbi:MAG: DUF397 domain-containing protein [Pseudonocardiales bacterium]|nr:DUF397 domain-containing protein [Pseudonocardiales bacterium]